MNAKIEVDAGLLAQVMEISRIRTDAGAVDAALRSFIDNERRGQALDALRGLGWEGDLDAMREGWPPGEAL